MPYFDIPAQGGKLRDRFPLTPRTVLLAAVVVFGIVMLLAAGYAFLVPPRGFPAGHLIDLPEDATVSEMGAVLESAGAIRSSFLFKAYSRLTFQDRNLASGMYVFDRPLGLALVVHRIAKSQHGITPARITLTEGMTNEDMARTLEEAIPSFDAEAFLDLASTSEGYLFPDTYFFSPSTTPEEAYKRLRDRFDERIASVTPDIVDAGHSIEDIVIMASLLEREAKSLEDKRIVAGILWNRLAADMPLQVDAVFGYLRGENGYTPTAADLKIDSPYNTYLYKGLPPGPIANPGLESLFAATVPQETAYLYYLTGRDGKMYYGHDFEEHKRNRALYLD